MNDTSILKSSPTRFALLFPGQGAQYVGMGKNFLAHDSSAHLFDEAQDLLSIPLRRLMLEGPSDDLTATAIAQPAILLHSMLAFNYLKERITADFSCALGHSLGEYSALVSAGVISFADAIKAVHIRGKLMQEAVPRGLGAMAAVLGMDAAEIVKALADFRDEKSDDYAACANFNGPLQTVIAGTKAGVSKASEKLKTLGAKKIIELPVSAPFHCALMKPVQEKMAEVLSAITFNKPHFPIISNVSAQTETDGSRIRALLLEQIANPVRFTDCVNRVVSEGLVGDGYLELGPKNTLSSIVKKIDKDGTTFNIDVPEDLVQLNRGT